MNKVWLVTGANSGFGRAITEAAVAGDDIVVAAARNAAALDDRPPPTQTRSRRSRWT